MYTHKYKHRIKQHISYIYTSQIIKVFTTTVDLKYFPLKIICVQSCCYENTFVQKFAHGGVGGGGHMETHACRTLVRESSSYSGIVAIATAN